MGLRRGSVNLGNPLTPTWYKAATVTAPAAVGGSVTVDFSVLQQINSNASKNKQRAQFVGMAISRRIKYNLAAAANDAATAQSNRDCFFSINIQQPNLNTKYTKQDINLNELNMASRVINPAFCLLANTLPTKQGIYPRSFISDFSGESYPEGSATMVANNSTTDGMDYIDSWGDNHNIAVVGMVTPPATEFFINDVTMVPACAFSGDGPSGSWLSKDVLPLPALTNNSTPWRVTITRLVLTSAGFLSETINVEEFDIWIYVTFRSIKKSHRIGVLWTIENTAFSGNNTNPNPLFYRCLAAFPKYDNAQTDTGVIVPYAPVEAFTFLSGGIIRLFDGSDQVWPLENFSEAQRIVDHWNIGFNAGANPSIRFDATGRFASTIMRSVSSALVPGLVTDLLSPQLVGLVSMMPVVPVAANHLSMPGFPVGFMSDPNDGNKTLKVQTEKLTSDLAEQMRAIHVSQFYRDDSVKLLSFSVFGDANFPANSALPAIRPLVDSMSNAVDIVAPLVPFEANA